ncbi:MAG: efflux RND transporter permease subunit [Prevotellaceae bacterium]|jgi:HAE1 family hydrophobic/amphiphilic exporter-1|nr:efflux RND transporter permease subunit [Prevotellaceae bacterium]
MSLYEGAVKKPIMTMLCFVGVAIFGLYSLSRLPIDLLPDIESNMIMVMTSYPGASASDIENNLSRPLENTLNTVSNLKHITSNSSENSSLIILEFEYGYDIDVLTNDVRDKLDMITSVLPDGAQTPIIFKFSTDMIPIMMLSVQAQESQAALYKILDDNVANPLARISGVGSVSIAGAPQREIDVYCDPNKLEAYNLTVETISSLIAAENQNIPGGNFDIGNETYALRVEGEYADSRQLNNLVVGTYNGAIVYLRDVARVEDRLEERAQESYTNGVRGGMIVVQKQSGANSVQIANAVREALPALQKNLPPDVQLGVIMDTSDNIKLTISTLAETVILAIVFVIMVVFFFLGRWRATVIIGLVIPFSLIASFIYLAITGGTINIISLSALSIAIGMVVDDAIVVLENVTNHIERGADPKQAAVHGTNEVAVSVIASTMTIFAVFFPLTMVSGMTGVLFKQLGWMMCIIIFISLVSSLALTPMMCSQMLRLQKKQTRGFQAFYSPIRKMLDALDHWYSRMLNSAVRHRLAVVIGCAAFFLISLLCARYIGTEFFPTQDSGNISATLEMPIGTRMEISKDVASRITAQWRKEYPEIQVLNYRVGQADADNVFASMSENGPHIMTFQVRLSDKDERKRSMTEIADGMRADLVAYPELAKYQITAGGNAGMGGQSTADFEIYGYDMAATDTVAQVLKRELAAVKGVTEINISRGDYAPEYQVDFDREKLALHGLNLATAGSYLRNRINGSTASQYREDGDEYDIKVRYAPEFRTSLEDIENILLYNALGESIRVKEVGQVVERFAPPTIERKDRERIVTVSAVLSDVPLSDVVEAGQKLIDDLDLPAGISVQVAGTYEDQMESFQDLATLALLIVVLVFIVMAAEFESLTYPFVIMFSIPFAVSGVLIALFFTGITLNVMSLLGGIMLIGIVVKNGIVLIDFVNLCRERGQSVINAVITGGKSRLRPVLMTTSTTVLGMIPLAISQGQGAEMWRPLGVAVIGGLTISTVLTLILVPVLYCMFAGTGIKRQRRKLAKSRELNAYYQEHKTEMTKQKITRV